MKIKQILGWVLLLVISAACSTANDEDSDPTNNSGAFYMKAKVDGKLVEFIQQDLLYMDAGETLPGIFEAAIVGGEEEADQSGLKEGITITIKDTSPIAVKTYDYLEPFTETGYGLKGAVLGYINSTELKLFVSDVDEEDPLVQITELTNTYAKGKFSGKIYDILSGSSKVIAEGEFYVKRNN